MAFFAPHAQDRDPKQYLFGPQSQSLYEAVTVPAPPTATDDHFRRLPPFISNEKNEGRNRWHWRFDSPQKYQQYMKAYYRLVTEVDRACGRIVDELHTQGVLENTLVIFTTDNGYFHGEHGLADKWYPYEESIRVPLIVRDPRLPDDKRGAVCNDMVLSVDLAAFMLTAAGVTRPRHMQGVDFSPLYLAAEKPPWRTEFLYEHPTINSKDFIPASEALVRTDLKYIRWPEFNHEELFDLKNDPHEERNLAHQPEAAERLAHLREQFERLKRHAK